MVGNPKVRDNLTLMHENNKASDQHAHLSSLISASVIPALIGKYSRQACFMQKIQMKLNRLVCVLRVTRNPILMHAKRKAQISLHIHTVLSAPLLFAIRKL